MEQLNVWMDGEVKRYLRYLIDDPSPQSNPVMIHKEGWSCYVRGVKTTTNPSKLIKREVYGIQMKKFLHKWNFLDENLFDCVDWDVNGDALSDALTLFSLWATKHISGFCGVGKMMRRWKFWEDSACLSCDELVETTHHVVLCPCIEWIAAWDEAINSLEAWMLNVGTDPDIQTCICSTVRSHDPAHLFAAYTSLSTREAALEQDAIRWMNFMEGKISRKWRVQQEQYYVSNNLRQTAKSWAAGMVSNLLGIVHKMWILRNEVVHERDEQGLKVKEGRELEKAISEQFELGVNSLLAADQHFITRGRKRVENMMAVEKKTWLYGIQIAREVGEREEETEVTQLRDAMLNWLAMA